MSHGRFGRRLVFWASFWASFHLSECECRGSATIFAMSRYSDDFPMVDVIAICETSLNDLVEDAICLAEPGLIEV